MKRFKLTILICSILLGLPACSSQKGNNNESTETTQEESDMMDAIANKNIAMEEMDESEEEPNNEPDTSYGYNEEGTLGTMQLERNGQKGDPNFPSCYYGVAGFFKKYYVYQFECYPFSRFGDDDIASLTWCSYNNEIGGEEYSISVPSNVVLEGKTYRVERVIIGDWGKMGYSAIKYTLPSTIKIISFANLKHLKEVVLMEGIETISIRAFSGCVDLENVVIPSTVKKIEGLAFNYCPKLQKIRIPASVEDIGEGAAFIGVSKETVIEVEDGCKAFEGLKEGNLYVKGAYYKFNPDDLNLVFLKSENANSNDNNE